MKANNQPRQVYDFLKKNRQADFCDDCLGTATGVTRYTINGITSAFALFPKEFSRKLGVCPQATCQSAKTRDKLLTRAI